MIYHDMNGDPQAIDPEEVFEILSDYCCTGHPDEEETSATFGHSIEKVEGAMEIARALVEAWRDQLPGGLWPQAREHKLDKPKCPCCGERLELVDSVPIDSDDDMTIIQKAVWHCPRCGEEFSQKLTERLVFDHMSGLKKIVY